MHCFSTTRTLKLALTAILGLTASGCDTAELEDTEREGGLIVELGEESDASVPTDGEQDIIASVDLPDGGAITFVSAGEDSIAVVVDASRSPARSSTT